ncbi:phosphatase PAP2 family protein [Streptantibioticus silvisoli]|uniref:Phosphatase PAP2 family protein n=1 Tax=Streptantibioticus silvisoli TaxID=2705255 RepID=A0ABT6VZQ3_9ACTN|nr:phosphatase PAP2 family protein [Streptantibioticus silvisoli]MDI5962751.1 phosphatase PAP2 family protein [Streptantibioticus silvisoli]
MYGWTAVVSAALFAAAAGVLGVRPDLVLGAERWPHAWALGHRPAAAVTAARWVTDSGTGVWPYLLVVAAGLATGGPAARRLRVTGALAAFVVAAQLTRYGVMEAIARPRPDRAGWAAPASGFSFPSGHTTTSCLVAGVLCAVLAARLRPVAARWACAVVAGWAVVVGLSRVYLGVHWAGDVAGGWLFAVAWLSAARWWCDRCGVPRGRPAGSEPRARR